MKVVAFTLAMLLGARAVASDIPVCDKLDAECLLRQSLQLTFDLEASRKENAILRHNLDEEIKRGDSNPKFFIFGVVVGAGFLGIAATIALKATKAGAK